MPRRGMEDGRLAAARRERDAGERDVLRGVGAIPLAVRDAHVDDRGAYAFGETTRARTTGGASRATRASIFGLPTATRTSVQQRDDVQQQRDDAHPRHGAASHLSSVKWSRLL